jgi:hypothetical protein
VIGDRRAAQRLLVLGVTASTSLIVRWLRDGRDRTHVRGLMSERRRMLRELEVDLSGTEFDERLKALGAAVAESDRTVEELIERHPP